MGVDAGRSCEGSAYLANGKESNQLVFINYLPLVVLVTLHVSALHVVEDEVVVADLVEHDAVESDIFDEFRETDVVDEGTGRVKPLLDPCSYLVGLGVLRWEGLDELIECGVCREIEREERGHGGNWLGGLRHWGWRVVFLNWGEFARRCVWSERKGCHFFLMDREKFGSDLI